MNDTVSIIIPVYNYEKYLRRCVDSVMLQDYSPIEIILIDDGSTDSSPEICDDYAERYDNVYCIHQTNSGVSTARLNGVRKATGAYVAFVDADDWIDCNHISDMVSKFSEEIDWVAAGAIRYWDYGGCEEKNRLAEGYYKTQAEKGYLLSNMLCEVYPFSFGITPFLWNKLYRKNILMDVLERIDNGVYIGEDVVINCLYALRTRGVYLSDECTYHYIEHRDSSKLVRKNDYFEKASRLYIAIYNEFAKHELSTKLLSQLDQYFCMVIWSRNEDGAEMFSKVFFPFTDVRMGERIILYGAGRTGQIFYHQVTSTGFCRIVSWVDKKPIEEWYSRDVHIDKPEDIKRHQFDKIVIAIRVQRVVDDAIKDLIKMGVPREKIITVECKF